MEVIPLIGKDIVTTVLEAKDRELKEEEHRKDLEVVRREDSRSVLTLFGEITYRRTYYRHRETGEYLHLLDRYTGYRKRGRLDPLLEALLLERSVDCSYRESSQEILPENQDLKVSPEVVKRLVHRLKRKEEEELLPKGNRRRKKKLPFLFIEADEDHVPWQGKGYREKSRNKKEKRLLAKLAYVHEGKEKGGRNRVKLKNPHYFAGLYPDLRRTLVRGPLVHRGTLRS